MCFEQFYVPGKCVYEDDNEYESHHGIRDVMSDYLVDDMFILVFNCDVQRRKIRGVVIEAFEISDVGNIVVLSDEVTDSLYIICITSLDVVYFMEGPLHQELYLSGALFPLSSVSGYSRNTKSPTD